MDIMGTNPLGETLTGTSGNDNITALDGPDSITSGGGLDSIIAAGGNDTITLDGPVTDGSSFNGGSDNDTLLVLAGAISSPYFGTPSLSGVNLSSSTVSGIENLQFGSLAGEQLNIGIGAWQGISNVQFGAGNDSLLLIGLPFLPAALPAITFGSGDAAVVFLAANPGTYNFAPFSLTNWDPAKDVINLLVTPAATAGQTYTLNASAQTVGLTLQGAASDDSLVGGSGNDTILSGGGRDSLLGGDGDDTLTLNGAVTNSSSFDGGAGNDTLLVLASAASSPYFTPTLSGVNLSSSTVSGIENLQFGSLAGEQLNIGIGAWQGISNVQFGAGTDALAIIALPFLPIALPAITFGSGNASVAFVAVAPGTYSFAPFSLTNWDPAKDAIHLLVNSSAMPGEAYTINAGAQTVGLNIHGAASNDLLTGGSGNDVIISGGGRDSLLGGDGDDTLTLNGAVTNGSVFDGSNGTDTLVLQNMSASFPTLNGPTSAYNLNSGAVTSIERIDFQSAFGTQVRANLALAGTVPNQVAGLTEVNGGAGIDTLILVVFNPAGGSYDVPTFAKTDWTESTKAYLPGDGIVLVGAGNGNYVLNASVGHTGREILVGGNGNDTLNGTDGVEVLSGGGGVDMLHGGGGNDALAIGNFIRTSGPGAGIPTTLTGAGSLFDGGDGHDFLSITGYVNFQGTLQSIEGVYLAPAFTSTSPFANSQAAAVLEISGATLAQLPGNLELDGTGSIIINLDTGDTFNGAGYVFNSGSNIAFTVNGSDGDDIIIGTVKGDTLQGDEGNDSLTGGTGADLFQPSQGNDVVADFTLGTDKVDLRDVGISSFAQLQPYLAQVGNDVVFSLLYNGVVNTLTLQNVALGSLTANDFLLHPATDPIVNSGTDNADVLFGAGGNDVLSGLGGNDVLFSGGGKDTLQGGDADDTLVLDGVITNGSTFDGGAGTDTIELRNLPNAYPGIVGPTTQFSLNSNSLTSIERLDFQSQSGTQISAVMGLGGFLPNQTVGLAEVKGGMGTDAVILVAFNPAGGPFTIPTFTKTDWTAPTKAYLNNGDTVVLVTGSPPIPAPGSFNYTLNASVGHSGLEALIGQGGNDTLNGSDGMERLTGGGGVNELHGGGGDDALFIGNSIANNPLAANYGILTTFNGAGSLFDGGDGTDFLMIGGHVDFQGTLQSIEGIYLAPAIVSNHVNVPTQAAAVLDISGAAMAALPADLILDGIGRINVNLAPGAADNHFDGTAYAFETAANVRFYINGSTDNDVITGTTIGDSFTGGLGDDTITGGNGIDIAHFAGNAADYAVTDLGGGALQFVGADGTDSVAEVEVFRFTDGYFTWDGSALVAEATGTVSDGYVSGATVFIDVNDNGLLDIGEDSTTTDSNGNFLLPTTQVGALRAVGGTNTDTGLPNAITLSAPVGSTMVNPLTTVVQALVAQGTDPELAETQVKAALGIDASVDLNTFDPLDPAANSAIALTVQQAAISVAVVLTTVIATSGGNAQSEAAGLKGIADAVAAATPGQPLDLTNSATLAVILTEALPDASDADIAALATQTAAQTTAIELAISIEAIANVQTNYDPALTGAAATLPGGTEDTPYVVASATLLQGYTDFEQDTLSVSGLSADHGAVSDNGDGTFTVTPAANYHGLVTLHYTVIDGQGGAAPGTLAFSLAAINDAPTLTGAQAALADGTAGSPYIITATDLLAGFTDADGDELTIADLSADTGTLVDNFDGTFIYTPAANYSGPVSLSYNVTDGHGSSAPGTQGFTLVSANQPPVAVADLTSADEDGSVTGNVLTGVTTPASIADNPADHDPNAGDVLTVTGVNGNAVGQSISGTYGTLVLNADGSYAYTADADILDVLAPGTAGLADSFEYTISDGHGGVATSSLTVSINILNDGVNLTAAKANAALAGGSGDDTLNGGNGNNSMSGGAGGDKLYGNSGNDSLGGGDGIDYLNGGQGDDSLNGGNGADILVGGKGSDILFGGAGADVFVFADLSRLRETDTVMDFQAGLDHIYLASGVSVSSINEASGSANIALSNGGHIVLNGITGVAGHEDLFFTPHLPDWSAGLTLL